MTDATTKPVLKISADPLIGPRMKVLESQMPEIERWLENSGLTYWFDSFSISYNGAPAVIHLTFSRKTDPAKLRAILDLHN